MTPNPDPETPPRGESDSATSESSSLPESSPATEELSPPSDSAYEPTASIEEIAEYEADSGFTGAPPPGGGDGGSGDDEPEESDHMTFLHHLEELRARIIHSVIAIVVGFMACWTFADEIYAALALPLTRILRELNFDDHLVYTSPTAPFTLYVQLALVAAIFVTSPYVIWQVWRFISPGLYPHERRYAIPFIFFCSLLFISGGYFAYAIAFPATLRFLLNFALQFQPMITVNEYFSLALTIILGLALVFELPMLILFLTLLRVLTPGFLMRNFRYAVLLIFVLAAVITPTPDVPTMMLFAAPLIALYFVGVGLSYLVVKMRRKRDKERDRDG